jgi:hypothetical protein
VKSLPAGLGSGTHSWIRLALAVPDGDTLGLLFTVSKSRRHPAVLQRYRVSCLAVREYHIESLDAGGIRLYGCSHPAARVHLAGNASLRVTDAAPAAVLASLLEAHARELDDWIPPERYLGDLSTLRKRLATGRWSVTGPAFVLRAYAIALRQQRVPCALKTQASERQTKPLSVLHFSQSFVVAQRFVIDHLRSERSGR